MATVEELRDELLAWYENPDDKYEVESRVYALIAAVRAEGVAAERERILSECSCIAADDRSLHQSGREFVAGELWYYFPASVLAPDKESEK